MRGASCNERANCTDYANFATVMTICLADGKNAHATCKYDQYRVIERIGEWESVKKRTIASDHNPFSGIEIGCIAFEKYELKLDIGKVLAIDPHAPS